MVLRNAGKTQLLLTNLAIAPHCSMAREAVLEAVWPDVELGLAAKSLYSLTYQLHKLLGERLSGAAPVIQADGFYRLNVEAGVGLDTSWFESLASTGEQQARVGDRASAIHTYLQAVESVPRRPDRLDERARAHCARILAIALSHAPGPFGRRQPLLREIT